MTPPTVYIDPDTHSALLFGAVPPHITSVQAVIHRLGRSGTELRTIAAQDAYFIAPLPSDARVLNLIGLDARGEPRLHCDPRSCEESR